MLGSNLPDIDGFAYLFGSREAALHFRRGWTHGILAMVVLPVLLAGAMVLLGRWRSTEQRPQVEWRGVLLLAALGTWSHPLLDLLNVYGVRLLMPFSDHWYKADALFIVDPWLWLVLAGGLLAGRLRRSERPSRSALAMFAGYALAMTLIGGISRHLVAEKTGVSARTMAAPVFGNPFRREILRDLGGEYQAGELVLGFPSTYSGRGSVKTGQDLPGVAEAQRTPKAQWFLRWARFPVFESRPASGGLEISIQDLRFGTIGGRSWAGITVQVRSPTDERR